MDKVLVLLEVPTISAMFDVNIPIFLTVNQVVEMLTRSLKELSDGKYVSSNCEVLCLKDRNILLNGNDVIGRYHIENGDHLILL